jgi:hypothetical protein
MSKHSRPKITAAGGNVTITLSNQMQFHISISQDTQSILVMSNEPIECETGDEKVVIVRRKTSPTGVNHGNADR